MAANVSESPGQPPGNSDTQSPPAQMSGEEHQKSNTENEAAQGKQRKEKQSTPALCSPSKSKRRLDSSEGHDNDQCDPQLENLCRKKFKPIAPKPTVKKDQHQSVVTATVPIKNVSQSDFASPFCVTKGDGKNGAVMYVSPKVQLIPGVPLITHAPPVSGDTLAPSSSAFSVTVPLLPNGKYLNIMTPPARVSMTDVAGHYKTVVQLLPNGSSGCMQTGSHVVANGSVNKTSDDICTSKPGLVGNEQSNCRNGTSTNRSSKAKAFSKPKASRYKYSLLMNGGSYDGAVLNAATNHKSQTRTTPTVSLNGGVRLSLPAVLTSSGVLQITVPSVGIANGQIQFCDVPTPAADVVQTQSGAGQTTTTQPACTSSASPTSTAQPVHTPNSVISTASSGVTLTNGSDSNTHHGSVSHIISDLTSSPTTNTLSLDETLKVMLRSPRVTVSHDRQKETETQTKKSKPCRTNASAAKSRHKGHKSQSSTSVVPPLSANSSSNEHNSGRSGITNTVPNKSVDKIPSNPAHGIQRVVPSGYVSGGQNVQYGPSVNDESISGSEVMVNQESSGTRPLSYAVSVETVSIPHPATSVATSSSDNPDLSSRLTDAVPTATVASTTCISVNSGLASTPSQMGCQDYGRQSSLSISATATSSLQSAGRVVNSHWSRIDTIAPRASSLPNIAPGPKGFLTSTTTAPLITFNVPRPTSHLAPQRPLDSIPVPSLMNFDQGMVTSVSTLPASSVMPSMQTQQPQQTSNVVVTTTNLDSGSESVTSVSGFCLRMPFICSTGSNAIVRNSHSHLQRTSSVHHSHDAPYSRLSVHSVQMSSETIRPPANCINSSHQMSGHLRQNANSHTAVTYSHNTVTSLHSVNPGYPSVLSGSHDSNVSTESATSVPCGSYLPEVNRPRLAPVPSERGRSIIEGERGVAPTRRQLHLSEETPGSMHPEIEGDMVSVGHNQTNGDLPPGISRQTNQDPVVQRQSVDTSFPRPNDLELASLPNVRPEQRLFNPPMTVVPHHAGILATAILRSRALERNPWRVPSLTVSTASTVSNAAMPTATTAATVTPYTSGYFGVSVCSTQAVSATNGGMSHTHHPGHHMLHLRATPSMPASLGRSTEGALNRNEGDNLSGGHTTQLTLEGQGRMAALPANFSGIEGAELEQPCPNPVTTTAGEPSQSVQAHVQSVPLHSNIPANARNAMNEALQRRTRNLRVQPPRSSTPSSVVGTQSHTSSIASTSNHEGSNLGETHPGHLGTNRQEMTTSDSQLGVRGQPRHDLVPHQHTPHHMHTMPGPRLPSDSVSHLPMPLMPPPSVLYGSSTPVPNLSMTPIHGVPLPGSLSAHSMQGHSMTHQLHATPPPAPHHGQSAGPNPQGPVNHMFVSTPYGPVHRSLCMPPPSPHPPDLSLLSPRSYGQVHMHDSVLYSPRFSSPIRNLPGSSLTEGVFGSTLPRSFSDDRLDTCCSGPYAHSPPIHDNPSHMFPPGFISPSMSRNQPSLQTSMCSTLQRPFNHRSHQGIPDRLPGPFFHEGMRHPTPHQLHVPVMQTASFASTPSTTAMTIVSSSVDASTLVSAVSSCNPTQQSNVVGSLPVIATSPASSSSAAATPGSTASSGSRSASESSAALPLTPTSTSSSTSMRVFNLGSTSDKYLPLELVVSSPSAAVTTSASVPSLPAQLSSEQIVKFGDVILECSRQILRESGRTVLCCWGCDYHTAEPKKMYRHQRRDEQPMKCQLCSHMGASRCQLNQHFKEVHMDKDEDPFRTSAVT